MNMNPNAHTPRITKSRRTRTVTGTGTGLIAHPVHRARSSFSPLHPNYASPSSSSQRMHTPRLPPTPHLPQTQTQSQPQLQPQLASSRYTQTPTLNHSHTQRGTPTAPHAGMTEGERSGYELHGPGAGAGPSMQLGTGMQIGTGMGAGMGTWTGAGMVSGWNAGTPEGTTVDIVAPTGPGRTQDVHGQVRSSVFVFLCFYSEICMLMFMS